MSNELCSLTRYSLFFGGSIIKHFSLTYENAQMCSTNRGQHLHLVYHVDLGASVISYQLYISSIDSLWQGAGAALVQEYPLYTKKLSSFQASGVDSSDFLLVSR